MKKFTTLLIVLAQLALPLVVLAQSTVVTPPPQREAGSNNILSSDDTRNYRAVAGTAAGGTFLEGLRLGRNGLVYTFSLDLLGVSTCTNLVIYRVTADGNLSLHPYICNGDSITLTSAGVGDYLVYQPANPATAQVQITLRVGEP